VSRCPSGAIAVEGETAAIKDIVDVVLQDEAFYKKSNGGVTLSGGEVLGQADEAVALSAELHKRGVSVAVDTSGYGPAPQFQKLMDSVDFILFDMKHWNSGKHLEGTGYGNESILKNLSCVLEMEKPVQVRIPVIPGFNDALSDAAEFAGLMRALRVKSLELLPFHQFGEKKYELLRMPYPYKNVLPLNSEELEGYKDILKVNGIAEVLL
jgi:pyruvate formate lyase activating enzyme